MRHNFWRWLMLKSRSSTFALARLEIAMVPFAALFAMASMARMIL